MVFRENRRQVEGGWSRNWIGGDDFYGWSLRKTYMNKKINSQLKWKGFAYIPKNLYNQREYILRVAYSL